MNEPALMLADEPTGNLDSKASDEIISLLRLSNKKYNQTVIIITHDEKIALEADRIITIDDGKIIKDERNGKYVPCVFCKVPYVFFEVRNAFKNVVKNKKETVAFHNATVL